MLASDIDLVVLTKNARYKKLRISEDYEKARVETDIGFHPCFFYFTHLVLQNDVALLDNGRGTLNSSRGVANCNGIFSTNHTTRDI